MMRLNITPYVSADDAPAEHWIAQMRLQRDRLLAESDWTQTTDDPTGRRDEWADYRQALRDFPATWTPGPTADFPYIPLPTPPDDFDDPRPTMNGAIDGYIDSEGNNQIG